MKIRKANINDFDRVKELLLQVHEVHANNREDIFIKGKKKFKDDEIKKILEDKNSLLYVAEENEIVLGHILMYILETKNIDSLVERKVLFIDDLCVDRNARGKSIGTKLCKFAEDIAKENFVDAINLNVWNFNKDSLKFYEKLGYKALKTLMEKR